MITKNLTLYPPAEPNPSEKLLARQKPLPMEESELENEEVGPILTIG